MRKRVPLREVRMYVDEKHDLVLIDYEWVTGNYVRRIESCSIPEFVQEFMDSHDRKRVYSRERGRWELVWTRKEAA